MDSPSIQRRPPRVTAEEKKQWRRLHRLVLRSGVRSSDADDVTQHVMMAVSRAQKSFVVPEGQSREHAFRAWCGGVVRLVVLHYRAARARERFVKPCADPHAASGATEAWAPSAEDQAVVRTELVAALAILSELTEERRALFVAHDIEGASISEVAAEMKVSVHTAWSRLRRARLDVRAAVSRRAAHRPGAGSGPPAKSRRA